MKPLYVLRTQIIFIQNQKKHLSFYVLILFTILLLNIYIFFCDVIYIFEQDNENVFACYTEFYFFIYVKHLSR